MFTIKKKIHKIFSIGKQQKRINENRQSQENEKELPNDSKDDGKNVAGGRGKGTSKGRLRCKNFCELGPQGYLKIKCHPARGTIMYAGRKIKITRSRERRKKSKRANGE